MTILPRLGLVVAEPPGGPSSWRALGAWASSVEAAGADSIWLTDHLFWHRPTVDVLGALALVAAGTERVTIGSCVLQLPLRNPAAVAKSAAFLAALAPGRVVLGVGVGEHEGEYAAAGRADVFHRRGSALDEGIDVLREAWSAEEPFRLSPGASVPVWVGGRSSAAQARAVARADGWVPHLVRAASLAADLARMREALDAADRDRSTFTQAAVIAVDVDEVGDGATRACERFGELYRLPARAFERVLVHGSAEQVAAEVVALAEAGVDEVILFPAGPDAIHHLTTVRHALGA